MLRPLIISVSLLGSLYASANTVEVATDLFSKRGEDVNNAKKAAKIFKELASNEADLLKKGKLLISASESIYYVGTQAEKKKEKMKIHEDGYIVGRDTAKILEAISGEEAVTQRSRALYFYGANHGKFGEAKGIFSSLGIWKDFLKPRMLKLTELNDTVEDFGVYRILGRAFMKVPGESRSQGVKYLEKAYNSTLVETDDFLTSRNSTSTLYLLAAYKQEEEAEEFCEVYENFEAFIDTDRQVQDDTNPGIIPENQSVIEQFKGSKTKEIKKIKKYYNEEC
jgi:hypothetical protein